MRSTSGYMTRSEPPRVDVIGDDGQHIDKLKDKAYAFQVFVLQAGS